MSFSRTTKLKRGLQFPSKSAIVRQASTQKGNVMEMEKVDIAEKFEHIAEYWKPYIAGELNGQLVKLVKFMGEFVWHHHENEDELFFVVKGRFRIEFRERVIWLEQGEFLVVPRGVEHRPVANEEVWVALFEPASTLNTGIVENQFTLRQLQRV